MAHRRPSRRCSTSSTSPPARFPGGRQPGEAEHASVPGHHIPVYPSGRDLRTRRGRGRGPGVELRGADHGEAPAASRRPAGGSWSPATVAGRLEAVWCVHRGAVTLIVRCASRGTLPPCRHRRCRMVDSPRNHDGPGFCSGRARACRARTRPRRSSPSSTSSGLGELQPELVPRRTGTRHRALPHPSDRVRPRQVVAEAVAPPGREVRRGLLADGVLPPHPRADRPERRDQPRRTELAAGPAERTGRRRPDPRRQVVLGRRLRLRIDARGVRPVQGVDGDPHRAGCERACA